MASIHRYQRKKGVVWKVMWRDPVTKNPQAKSFTNAQEAEDFKQALEVDIKRGVYEDRSAGKQTFGDFWTQHFIPDYVERHLSPKAAAGYKRYGERCLLPYLKNVPLRDIKPQTAVSWAKWAEEQRFAPSTVAESFVVARSALSYAAQGMSVIPGNPWWRMKRFAIKKHVPKRVKTILSPIDIRNLVEKVKPRYSALVMLLGVCGLRPSEAIGLKMGDLSLTESTLTIRRSVVNVEGRMVENDTTKTRKVRTINLPQALVEKLMNHVSQFVQEPSDDSALLFPSANKGAFIHTDFLRNGVIVPAAKELGLKVTTYDLRHSATVNGIQATQDVKYVSEMLGHSDISMTQDVYNHLTSESSKVATTKLGEAFD